MSNRSNRYSRARQPLAPRPLVGRHARKIARLDARKAAGDFSAGLRFWPLVVTYRRLVRAVRGA